MPDDTDQPAVFKPANILVCQHCQGQNLNWCLACCWCGRLFDDDDDVVVESAAVEAA